MPLGPPPDKYTGQPASWVLPAGTPLWRVHHKSRSPAGFNEAPAHKYFGGGRFDATADDNYPYLYAASADTTALAETLLRSLPFAPRHKRTLPRKSLSGRRLCRLETTTDLTFLSLLSSTDLAAVKQDDWLIYSEARDYAFTRHWAHWLRDQAAWAQGLVWRTRRDIGEFSAVLFGDRCPPGALQAAGRPGLVLDDAAGARQLNEMLAAYDVRVYPPRTSGARP